MGSNPTGATLFSLILRNGTVGHTCEAEITAASAFKRGHEIKWVPEEDKWVYADTEEPIRVDGEENERPCVKCERMPTEEGHDPYVANLPGVENACCGHGVEPGYISFEDGTVVRGNFSLIQEPDDNHINFYTSQ